ncbi:hypothetical protein OG410_41705 [Streptomyces sp. NBC_00659]|jgi:hypothetical protein|uniref:hypothetical protein n=1 Tax=Streptomyces sp. NBC_00659 TaxID=2903669 RepID=UPI002E374E1E|nr:hypothetical protein [Streptomyces sp. NBC_00659]
MACDCNAALSVQLHDGGDRYPVIPAEEHGELSYWFNARCTVCNAPYEEPFRRVDASGQVMDDQRADLPLADRTWLTDRCGPFTCGCDQDALQPGLINRCGPFTCSSQAKTAGKAT